jgi:hypothetical protein
MEHEARGQAGDEAEMSGHFHNPELGVRSGTFLGNILRQMREFLKGDI